MKPLPEASPDTPSINELIECISRLELNSAPLWGTMNSLQMCRHCINFIHLYQGKIPVSFPIRMIARLVGGFFLKKIITSSPKKTPKSLRTLSEINSKDYDGKDLDLEKSTLIQLLKDIGELKGHIQHPLYGLMNSKDVIALIRHHTAHHMNQFGLMDETI